MKPLFRLLDWMQGDGRRAALFSALGSASILSMAYFFQYVIKLLPCQLCYLERKPHMAIIALGLIVALLKNPKARTVLLTVMALAALGNSGLSFFHVGVEQHWWTFESSCTTPNLATTDLESARALIFESTVVPCDKAVWWFLGISMAGWNGIISVFMAAWAAFAAKRSWTNKRGTD